MWSRFFSKAKITAPMVIATNVIAQAAIQVLIKKSSPRNLKAKPAGFFPSSESAQASVAVSEKQVAPTMTGGR